jgi:hypothetical protein
MLPNKVPSIKNLKAQVTVSTERQEDYIQRMHISTFD